VTSESHAYGADPSFEVARVSDEGHEPFRPRMASLERVAELLRVAFRDAELAGVPYLDWFAHLARVSRGIGEGRAPAGVDAMSAR
jgi:hypothetical protein